MHLDLLSIPQSGGKNVKSLIVLVARVDLFELSSGPPERTIKWPKTGGSIVPGVPGRFWPKMGDSGC